MRPIFILAMIALSSCIGCSDRASAANDDVAKQAARTFKVDGASIHPACLWELLTDMPDAQPRIAAVDVRGIAASERYHDWQISDEAGRVRATWRENAQDPPSSTGYRFIGVTANNRAVVEVWESGGGTGVFISLLVVEFQLSPVRSDIDAPPQQRLTMRTYAQVGIGDRIKADYEINGNAIRIKTADGESVLHVE